MVDQENRLLLKKKNNSTIFSILVADTAFQRG